MSKKIKCCICGRSIKDHKSNNPRPYKESGRCCDKCDGRYVLPERIRRGREGLDPHGDTPYQWSVERKSSFMTHLIRTGDFGKPVITGGFEK